MHVGQCYRLRIFLQWAWPFYQIVQSYHVKLRKYGRTFSSWHLSRTSKQTLMVSSEVESLGTPCKWNTPVSLSVSSYQAYSQSFPPPSFCRLIHVRGSLFLIFVCFILSVFHSVHHFIPFPFVAPSFTICQPAASLYVSFLRDGQKLPLQSFSHLFIYL